MKLREPQHLGIGPAREVTCLLRKKDEYDMNA
jgi:hypothetical protein